MISRVVFLVLFFVAEPLWAAFTCKVHAKRGRAKNGRPTWAHEFIISRDDMAFDKGSCDLKKSFQQDRFNRREFKLDWLKKVLPGWAFGRQISFVMDSRAFPKQGEKDQMRRASIWDAFVTGTKGAVIIDDTCCNRFQHIPVDDCCAQRAMVALDFYDKMTYQTSQALVYPFRSRFSRTAPGRAVCWDFVDDFRTLVLFGNEKTRPGGVPAFPGCPVFVRDFCSNGRVIKGEFTGAACESFPRDERPLRAPRGWTCDPARWDESGPGPPVCDCGCGLWDPDCAKANAVSSCAPGSACLPSMQACFSIQKNIVTTPKPNAALASRVRECEMGNGCFPVEREGMGQQCPAMRGDLADPEVYKARRLRPPVLVPSNELYKHRRDMTDGEWVPPA